MLFAEQNTVKLHQ